MGKQLIFLGLIVLVCAWLIEAATIIPTTTHAHRTGTHRPHNANHTKGPHTTSEPYEKEGLYFRYFPTTQHMILRIGKLCYVDTLDDTERVAVHTDDGLRQLETKLLTSTASATEITRDQLTNKEMHMCGNHTTHVYQWA